MELYVAGEQECAAEERVLWRQNNRSATGMDTGVDGALESGGVVGDAVATGSEGERIPEAELAAARESELCQCVDARTGEQ
jgi:hypothetical protein